VAYYFAAERKHCVQTAAALAGFAEEISVPPSGDD